MLYIFGLGYANFFFELAEKEGQGPALATFLRGMGYMKFEGDKRGSLPVKTKAQLADEGHGAPRTEKGKYGK